MEFFLVHRDFDLTANLAYGSDAREHLDVYRPRAAKAAPVVVFLYGGRWQHGSKKEYYLLGQALAGHGLVAVVPDYSLYPQVVFPGWVEDAGRAVRWVGDSISSYGGDPKRIIIVGHSSGAHTAALLALDPQYLRRAGVAEGTVRGVVSLAGPVATAWTDPDVRTLMGPPERWRNTYPLELANGTGPPLLLLHGGRDKTVAFQNSVRLGSRICEHGGCARVVLYKNLTHFVRSPQSACASDSRPRARVLLPFTRKVDHGREKVRDDPGGLPARSALLDWLFGLAQVPGPDGAAAPTPAGRFFPQNPGS